MCFFYWYIIAFSFIIIKLSHLHCPCLYRFFSSAAGPPYRALYWLRGGGGEWQLNDMEHQVTWREGWDATFGACPEGQRKVEQQRSNGNAQGWTHLPEQYLPDNDTEKKVFQVPHNRYQ
ncbi:unnamed protein product [Caretta caretta]